MYFMIKALAALAVIVRSAQSQQDEDATSTHRRALAILDGQAGQAVSSLCFLPGGQVVTGPVDCPGGEAQLLGQYVNVGVNQAGSFGTSVPLNATYYTHTPRLGLLADYDRNGFATSTPGYSGDYFQGGGPVEGWLLQYTTPTNTKAFVVSEGLAGRTPVPATTFAVTTSPDQLSAIWVARTGPLELRKVFTLDKTGLFITSAVTIRNIGDYVVPGIYYSRTMEPDHEYWLSGSTFTNNYVKYQPSSAAFPAYVRTESPNTALVCSVGNVNYDFYLGLATVNSKARATHFGSQVFNPTQSYTHNTWKSYGGNDMLPMASYANRMRYADEAVHLTYLYPSLSIGEVINIEYVHVMHPSDQDIALKNLENVLMVQPTDVLSGGNATLSFAYKNAKVHIVKARWYVYATLIGHTTAQWHTVKTLTDVTYAPSSLYSTTLASIDTTLYQDGLVHVRVEAETAAPVETYRKSRVVEIRNAGPLLCIQENDPNNFHPLPQGDSLTLTLNYCPGSDTSVSLTSVSAFVETVLNDEVVTKLALSLNAPQLPLTFVVPAARFEGLVVRDAVTVRTSSSVNESVSISSTFTGVIVSQPTAVPSAAPSASPTIDPTIAPSAVPTVSPTTDPSASPSAAPTLVPTAAPTRVCVQWTLGDYGETCSATCGRLDRVCKNSYFESITTQEAFYSMVGSAVNVRTGGGAVGPAETFCGTESAFGATVGTPAALTVVFSTATSSPVRTTCSYPSSVAEVTADCDTELPLDSFRRFCPCVDHNCDNAWYLGYTGDSCDATCDNAGGECLVDPLSDIVDADSFQSMLASTTVLATGEMIGSVAASFCNDGTNLFTFASAPAAISLVHGSFNQTLCTFPTNLDQLQGDCGLSFHAPSAQRFCNCRVASGARKLVAAADEPDVLVQQRDTTVAPSARLRGSRV